MTANNAISVLAHALKLIHEDHLAQLLSIPQHHLDSIEPNKNLHLQDLLKSYNQEIAAEMFRYSNQLQTEVLGVLEGIVDSPEMPSKDEVMSVVADYLQPDLYIKRFEIFIQSIERRLRGFGLDPNLDKHRPDIPKSLAIVGAKNFCKKAQSKIANSVDKLCLPYQPSESEKSLCPRIYAKINHFHHEHPALFWLISLLISIILAIFAI